MQDRLMAKLRSLPDTLLQQSPYYILAVVYVPSLLNLRHKGRMKCSPQ